MHARRIIRLAIVLFVVSVFTASVASAKDAMLTFTWPKDRVLRYKMDIQTEMNFAGMDVTINRSGECEVTYVGNGDDGVKLAMKFSNVESSMMRGDDIMEQDSPMNNQVVHVTLSPHGKVVHFEPQEKLDAMTHDAVEGVAKNFFAYLPNKKVSKGDTWVQSLREESASEDSDTPEMEGEAEYELEDLKKEDGMQVAKMAAYAKVKINKMTPGGMFVGEAEGDVKAVVAIDGGYIVESSGHSDVTGKIGEGKFGQTERFECKLLQ